MFTDEEVRKVDTCSCTRVFVIYTNSSKITNEIREQKEYIYTKKKRERERKGEMETDQ